MPAFSSKSRVPPAIRVRYSPQVSTSGIFGRFPDQAAPPFRPQDVAPLRIFFVVVLGIDDAVGAETAEILAQFAPCREDPHRLVIADRDRPDRALAVTAVLVAIVQRDLPALVDLRPRTNHVDPVRLPVPGSPGTAGRLQHERPQAF